jgi:hypothetical protein
MLELRVPVIPVIPIPAAPEPNVFSPFTSIAKLKNGSGSEYSKNIEYEYHPSAGQIIFSPDTQSQSLNVLALYAFATDVHEMVL